MFSEKLKEAPEDASFTRANVLPRRAVVLNCSRPAPILGRSQKLIALYLEEKTHKRLDLKVDVAHVKYAG